MKRVAVAGGVVVALVAPAKGVAWDFRTPDGSIYCRLELPQNRLELRCARTSDGRWVRFAGDVFAVPRLSTGSDASYRANRDRRAYVLSRGRSWISSDASGITCWHFRRRVTCKAYQGMSFWHGRSRGYRAFLDKPGFRPHVRPLFRTRFGVRCGIELWTLEPTVPQLRCWRAADGRDLTLSPVRRGDSRLWPKSQGFRPRGFAPLRSARTLRWRCRLVDGAFGERCSTVRGRAVFTCRNAGTRLTCRNRDGHGFWVDARRFRLL